jgi:hypothetical protein
MSGPPAQADTQRGLPRRVRSINQFGLWCRSERTVMTQEALTAAALKRGGRYNWKNQPDRRVYLRKFNGWHQFKKIGDTREVWCEVLDADLHMLEETKPDYGGMNSGDLIAAMPRDGAGS